MDECREREVTAESMLTRPIPRDGGRHDGAWERDAYNNENVGSMFCSYKETENVK